MPIESSFSQIKKSEKFAEEMISHAEEEANKLIDHARKESERIRKDEIEKAKKAVDINKNQDTQKAEEEIKKIDEQTKAELAKLQEMSEVNKTEAVNFIISSVLE